MKTAVLSAWCMLGGENSCFSIKDCDRSKYKMRITSEKVLQVRKRVSKKVSKKAGQSKSILLVLTLLFVRLLKLKARLVLFLLLCLRRVCDRIDHGSHEKCAHNIDHGVLL